MPGDGKLTLGQNSAMTNAYEQASVTTFQAHVDIIVDLHLNMQKVFHVCEEGRRQSSFLCPRGTIFNQVGVLPSKMKQRISLLILLRSSEFAIGGTM